MPAHGHSVLVVDDNRDTADAIATLLRLHAYDVHLARDGEEAIATLRGGLRPCLVLLDVHMPRMDGIAFRRRQQADPALRDIPVAVLSALPRLHERIEPLAVVASYQKPVDPDRLVALVQEHCPLRERLRA